MGWRAYPFFAEYQRTALDWVEIYAELDYPNKKGKRARTAHKLKEEKFGETSELLEKERNLDVSLIEDIQEIFWEFHFRRKSSANGVMEPLDPVAMQAHITLSGILLSKWEYTLIMEMDLAFRAAILTKE